MEEPQSTDPLPTVAPSHFSQEQVDSWGVFILSLVLFTSVMVTYVLLRFRIRFIPESIITIAIGLLFGLVARAAEKSVAAVLALDPEFFFLFLLPPIMFESGYSLHRGSFFSNFLTVNIFAVIGTIISAVIVGLGIYGFGLIPAVGYNISLFECLIFGSLISAVDPVATLAIFKAIEVDPTLHMLVFGESILNDAVAIVLYRTFLRFLTSSITGRLIGMALLQFFLFFFGSLAVGLLFAVASALLLKHVDFRKYPTLEIALVFLFAYAPYVFSEAIGLSGIMAILFCGIGMAHYTFFNLSPVAQLTTERLFRSLAFLAETSVFAFLGLAIPNFKHDFNLALILISLVMIIIGRAMNVFPLSLLCNLFRKTKITGTMQFLMFFSGLRGAIAVALVLNLKTQISNYDIIFTNTLVVVLFTIIFFGGGTFPLVQLIEKCTHHSILKRRMSSMLHTGNEQPETEVPQPSEPWFEKLDRKYLVRWLRRPHSEESYKEAMKEIREITRMWPITRQLSQASLLKVSQMDGREGQLSDARHHGEEEEAQEGEEEAEDIGMEVVQMQEEEEEEEEAQRS